ncbi:MAG: hypothetical protein IKS48_04680 [Eubacterium sp.]|nr:hypothetical protein [Eubacterium sp.]
MADNKSYLLIKNYEQNIYRLLFQQVFIVFFSAVFVHFLFYEKELKSIKEYKIIYTLNIKNEIYSYFFAGMISFGILFLSGQIIGTVINLVLGGKIFPILLGANILVVSLEYATAVLLLMGLRLLFIKDIVVYGILYVVIFISMMTNNVFVSMPLSINILGVGNQEYYVDFRPGLWIGRLVLLSISVVVFKLGIYKFEKNIYTS